MARNPVATIAQAEQSEVGQTATAGLLPWCVLGWERKGDQPRKERLGLFCFEAGSHSVALHALNSCLSLQRARIIVINHCAQLPVGLMRAQHV